MIEQAKSRLLAAVETARKNGASGARVIFRQSERVGCEYDAGKLKEASTTQSLSLEVTVIADGRSGSAGGNDLAALDELTERASALAKVGSEAHFSEYPPAGEPIEVPMHSAQTADLTRENLIDSCDRMVAAIKDFDTDLHISASGSRSENEKLIVTSGGVCESMRSTTWSMGNHVQKTGDDGDMLFAGESRSWGELADLLDPAYLASGTVRDVRRGSVIAEPLRGKAVAVFNPRVFSQLLGALVMGVNGRAVARGQSPLADRIGERIFDEGITVSDDPHCPYAPGSSPMSNEGVPTRTMPLVEKGVLRHFLYDLDSAGLAGAEPTGHNGCRPYSLAVTPGQTPSDELIADIDDGVYVSYLMGFGQGNLINGDFSCNVGVGFRIRNGEIVGRVKNTMIAGNVYELLASGVKLSSDTEPTLRMPYAVIDGVSLSTEG
ncbi:MAG: TldD/PmbA family protein [Phycisphaerae bacterium]